MYSLIKEETKVQHNHYFGLVYQYLETKKLEGLIIKKPERLQEEEGFYTSFLSSYLFSTIN